MAEAASRTADVNSRVVSTSIGTGLARLAEAAGSIADVTGIPVAQVEKDFWITEVLRGVAAHGSEAEVTAVFKGGTSLSKAFGLIRRFSEDVDIVVVLAGSGSSAAHRILKSFVEAAENATGLPAEIDEAATSRGVRRTALFHYPTDAQSDALSTGVRLELGTRGGAMPTQRCFITSLLDQFQSFRTSGIETLIGPPIEMHVQAPVRTLIEKLMIVHHAAVEGDVVERQRLVRHYYDIWCLLRSDHVRAALKESPADVLARDTLVHSAVASRPATSRPEGGFAASPAFNLPSDAGVANAYEAIVRRQLLWPGSPEPTIEDCCQQVQLHASLL